MANSSSSTRATPTGRASRGKADRTWVNEVGWDFFRTMGIPILYGRGFGPQDRAGAPLVAVVNQAFVKNFYPGTNPVGQTFSTRSGRSVYQIIGVSADARYNRINAPMPPTFYRAYAQEEELRSMTFEVRTAFSPRRWPGWRGASSMASTASCRSSTCARRWSRSTRRCRNSGCLPC